MVENNSPTWIASLSNRVSWLCVHDLLITEECAAVAVVYDVEKAGAGDACARAAGPMHEGSWTTTGSFWTALAGWDGTVQQATLLRRSPGVVRESSSL